MIYVLEQKSENNVYPGKPQFHYIKLGCKGVYITRTCYHDGGTSTVPNWIVYIMYITLFLHGHFKCLLIYKLL